MTVKQLVEYYKNQISILEEEKKELLATKKKRLDKKTRLRLRELEKQIEEYENEINALL